MNILVPFCEKNEYGYCDYNKNIVIPCKYEFAYPFTCGRGGVRNYDNHLVGFIDCLGNKKIDFIYDYIHPFTDGYAWVCLNGLWGMIDIDGKIIIPYKYLKASKSIDGITIVQNLDRKWGCIDAFCNEVIPFYYDFLYYDNGFIGLYDGKWNTVLVNSNKCKVLKDK